MNINAEMKTERARKRAACFTSTPKQRPRELARTFAAVYFDIDMKVCDPL